MSSASFYRDAAPGDPTMHPELAFVRKRVADGLGDMEIGPMLVAKGMSPEGAHVLLEAARSAPMESAPKPPEKNVVVGIALVMGGVAVMAIAAMLFEYILTDGSYTNGLGAGFAAGLLTLVAGVVQIRGVGLEQRLFEEKRKRAMSEGDAPRSAV